MSAQDSLSNGTAQSGVTAPAENIQLGVLLAIAGYGVFSGQDAIVKWLVADHSIWQILFVRSLTVCLFILAFRPRIAIAGVLRSPNKASLTLRAGLILVAWLCYYTAARDLALPDLVTLYYAAPIFVTIMSILFLKESVNAMRWLSVMVGFAGVIVAANPTGRAELWPALLVLVAAIMWGLAVILMRKSMRNESSLVQMLFSNGLFVLVCGATLFWTWAPSDPFDLFLMVALGVGSGIGQFMLYESFRRAPASVIAPTEYTALVWAVILGYVIWQDLPTITGAIGAVLILLASIIVLLGERKRRPVS
ncbi:DMT family transporter [Dongia mobilis]|uniref:DMT family transporter n=1 Tax=Dongia mobilis TaxID=578943 RepID=UPI00105F9EA3|nr:DMT family transporter [Dongia mobilis]